MPKVRSFILHIIYRFKLFRNCNICIAFGVESFFHLHSVYKFLLFPVSVEVLLIHVYHEHNNVFLIFIKLSSKYKVIVYIKLVAF